MARSLRKTPRPRTALSRPVSGFVRMKRTTMSKTNRTNRYRVATWLTSFSLMVSLCLGILVTDRASAQTASGVPQGADQPVRANQDTYPELAHYATDLTALARAGRLEPVTGRSVEISRTVEILSLDIRNNPVLVGEPGL